MPGIQSRGLPTRTYALMVESGNQFGVVTKTPPCPKLQSFRIPVPSSSINNYKSPAFCAPSELLQEMRTWFMGRRCRHSHPQREDVPSSPVCGGEQTLTAVLLKEADCSESFSQDLVVLSKRRLTVIFAILFWFSEP